jgi:C4-dicarboxylate transporter DctQ subunit
MRAARSFLGVLSKLEAGIAVTAFSVVVAVLFADVAGRELFGHGVYWAQRLASYCTTAAGMLGFCLVVHTGGHLRPKAIEKTVPESWGPVMNRVADSVSALICLFMAYYGAEYVAASARIGQRGMSIEIIVWPIQIIIPYVFASGGLRYAAFAVFPELRPVESELQK